MSATRSFAQHLNVAVHGQSFRQRDITDNLVPAYPSPIPAGGHVAYDVEVHILSVQVRRVKAYLYLSALLLLTIVILTISWMTFPSFLLADDAAKRYGRLVHSISAYYGLQYVFILCSYYIPASLILSRRIRGLAYRAIRGGTQTPNEQTLEEWEKKSGLRLHDLRSYKTVAALLAPLFPPFSVLCWPWRESEAYRIL
ncbi:hypothetical protein AB8Z38_30550 [Bradyrhizobium sp. LLZ17]|uniref:RDD domain-containing protein n=1 Tax=Bradyrhizobium sp. LLZ17 TaxID=3239388 RepID=A0AB39XHB2_9BRAD